MALINYKEKNNKFPESIVVYRNLVEGEQLSYVHKEEIKLIKVSTFVILDYITYYFIV